MAVNKSTYIPDDLAEKIMATHLASPTLLERIIPPKIPVGGAKFPLFTIERTVVMAGYLIKIAERPRVPATTQMVTMERKFVAAGDPDRKGEIDGE